MLSNPTRISIAESETRHRPIVVDADHDLEPLISPPDARHDHRTYPLSDDAELLRQLTQLSVGRQQRRHDEHRHLCQPLLWAADNRRIEFLE